VCVYIGSKRMEEWEELAATACAVQNMHIQATSHPGMGACVRVCVCAYTCACACACACACV